MARVEARWAKVEACGWAWGGVWMAVGGAEVGTPGGLECQLRRPILHDQSAPSDGC